MNYTLSLKDALIVIKNNIRSILAAMVICALIMVIYALFFSVSNVPSSEEAKKNASKIENYEELTELKDDATGDLEVELKKAYKLLESNPIMSVDASDCPYTIVTFAFDKSDRGNRAAIVNAWINSIPGAELFGDGDKKCSPYRSSLVFMKADKGVEVILIDVGQYDVERAAKQIIKTVEAKADAAGLAMLESVATEQRGYMQDVFDSQDIIRQNIVRLNNEMYSMQNDYVQVPEQESAPLGRAYKVILFAIIGALIGLFIGIAIALLRVARKGTIVSKTQLESFFDLEHIADISNNSDADITMTDRIIGLLQGDNSSIIMPAFGDKGKLSAVKDGLSRLGGRDYLINDSNSESLDILDNVGSVGAMALPVQLGKITYEEVKGSIEWAEKYRKPVLGYINIEN